MVKLLVVAQLAAHPLLQPDSGLDTTAYVGLAEEVLAGNPGLGPGLYFVSPLYIYFLAAVLFLTDSFTAVRIVQVILGSASVACIWLTAREWFGTRAAWVAAVLAGLTGLFTFYEVLLLQAALDGFLTSAALLVLTRGLTSRHSWMFALAGLVFGIATLNRPNMLLASAAIAVALLLSRRWRAALLLATGLAAGLAPVVARNAIVSDQWSLVSSHGGLNFYIGNGEGATGFYRPVPGITPNIAGQQRDARRVASEALGRPVDDAAASEYFFTRAWRWIQSHPGEALMLYVRKLGWVFHAQHIALPHSFPFYADEASPLLRVLFIGPWLLIPLGVIGLVAAAPATNRSSYLIWLTFVPAYAGAVAVFFVSERYRLPLLVPLSIGAGAAIDWLVRAAVHRRLGALSIAATCTLAVGIAANWPHGLQDGRLSEGVRMAERLVIVGRYDEAEAWVQRLAPIVPNPANLHFVVGLQYLAARQHPKAIDHLSRARQLNASDANIAYALGQALFSAGRIADAIPHLRTGFDSGATLGLPGYDLALALQQAGDPAGALDVLRRIRPDADGDPEAWLRLGRLASELGAPETAEPLFRRAVAVRPESADVRLQYGLNLLALKRFDEAARELGEAVRLNPRDPDALVQLAYAEFSIGRVDDARRHTAAALAIDPNHVLGRQLAEVLR